MRNHNQHPGDRRDDGGAEEDVSVEDIAGRYREALGAISDMQERLVSAIVEDISSGHALHVPKSESEVIWSWPDEDTIVIGLRH